MDSECNAYSFLQPKKNKKRSNFDVDAGLFSTALTSMFCHKWKALALFQADAQYKALEGEHPLTSKFRGSVPRTGQT